MPKGQWMPHQVLGLKLKYFFSFHYLTNPLKGVSLIVVTTLSLMFSWFYIKRILLIYSFNIQSEIERDLLYY